MGPYLGQDLNDHVAAQEIFGVLKTHPQAGRLLGHAVAAQHAQGRGDRGYQQRRGR